jgi:hypothetical protein
LLKLAPDKPSWTIQAQPGPAIGPFHWNSRYLSELEMKRIQTFPDNYKIEGPKREIQRQLGNAVPPKLAEGIASALLDQIAKGDLTMASKGGGKSGGAGSGRGRDAGTGQYVPKKYAETHPKTTVIEHDKSKKK